MTTEASARRANPYVGPRAFRLREAYFYGRDRETRELADLVTAERIVILHAPSGAGKTSLIQASLIPLLEKDFEVLPVLRVSQRLAPDSGKSIQVANRYVLSVLLSLEEPRPPDQRLELAKLAGMRLEDYLVERSTAAGPPKTTEAERPDEGPAMPRPQLLIFDQFEEVLTLDPYDRDMKDAFFEQVGEALRRQRRSPRAGPDSGRSRTRWALFSMRDEYVAMVDPYLIRLPARPKTYQLDLLGAQGAVAAIRQPAENSGVNIALDAAEKLVDNLRRAHHPGDSPGTSVLGLYVEPVQLQVVCHRLWEHLPDGATQIGVSDIDQLADVDNALADFYSEHVQVIAAETGVSERDIRDWIEHQLITETGIRGQALQTPARSQGLANPAIWGLVNAYLVRAEARQGATWFELAHDRLIGPITSSNAAWRKKRLTTLQLQAALWQSRGRPPDLLVRDQVLVEGERWAAAHPSEMTAAERDFLSACQEARSRAEQEARKNRQIRLLAIGASVTCVISVALMVGASILALNNIRQRAQIDGINGQLVEKQKILETQNEQIKAQAEVINQVSRVREKGAYKSVADQQKIEATKIKPGGTVSSLKRWTSGQTLHVRFQDGEPDMRAKVEKYAQEWTRYTNLRFDFLPFDPASSAKAELRISFEQPGSWSLIGTDALTVPSNQPTINLGFLKASSPEEDYSRYVLHEFGHALGRLHENVNPSAHIQWNKPAVYAYYAGPPTYWSTEQVNQNLFPAVNSAELIWGQFDPQSIMMLPIPAEFTLNHFEVGVNTVLSAGDKAFAGVMYPFGAPVPLQLNEPALDTQIEKLRLDRFKFVVSEAGAYTIELHGPVGGEMSLFGPGDEISLIGNNQDTQQATSSRLVKTLDAGTYFITIRYFNPGPKASYTVRILK